MRKFKSNLNADLHSRMSKTLKKMLSKKDIELTQTQASELMANVFGFSNYHAANEFYSNKSNDTAISEDYMVSFSISKHDIYNNFEIINKKILFKGYAKKHLNLFECFRGEDLEGFVLSACGMKKLEDFFKQTSSLFKNEKERIEYCNNFYRYTLNANKSNVEEKNSLDKIFHGDEKWIELYDLVFSEYIENESLFVFYSKDEKHLKKFFDFKITSLTQNEAKLLENENLVDRVVSK